MSERDLIGEVFGPHRVTGVSSETYTYQHTGTEYLRNKLDCICINCGATSTARRESLYVARRENREHCAVCVPRVGGFNALVSGCICSQCCDLPHRRPVVGRCKCGKRFEREQIEPAEMYRGESSIARCAEAAW